MVNKVIPWELPPDRALARLAGLSRRQKDYSLSNQIKVNSLPIKLKHMHEGLHPLHAAQGPQPPDTAQTDGRPQDGDQQPSK